MATLLASDNGTTFLAGMDLAAVAFGVETPAVIGVCLCGFGFGEFLESVAKV